MFRFYKFRLLKKDEMHVQHRRFCVQSPHSSTASRRTHLSIGRSSSDVFVFTFTRRTHPSLPGMTSITLAIGQQLLGELSSTINTMSSTAKFLRGKFHFCRCCNKGMYSRDHRLQNWSARYCTCRHLLREKVSSFLKIPGGKTDPDRSRSKWFGVRASKSLGS